LDAQLRLGRMLVLRRRLDEAGPLLEAARAAAERQGSPGKAATAIHLLALLERHRDPAKGLRLLDEHTPGAKHGVPGPQLAQWFHFRGLLEAERNQPADAERLLYRALDYYKEVPDPQGEAEV